MLMSVLPVDLMAVDQHDNAVAGHPALMRLDPSVSRESTDSHPSSNLTSLAVGGRIASGRAVPGQNFPGTDGYHLGQRIPHLTNRSPSWADRSPLSPGDVHWNGLRQEREAV